MHRGGCDPGADPGRSPSVQVGALVRADARAKQGAGFPVSGRAAEPMRTPPKRAPGEFTALPPDWAQRVRLSHSMGVDAAGVLLAGGRRHLALTGSPGLVSVVRLTFSEPFGQDLSQFGPGGWLSGD